MSQKSTLHFGFDIIFTELALNRFTAKSITAYKRGGNLELVNPKLFFRTCVPLLRKSQMSLRKCAEDYISLFNINRPYRTRGLKIVNDDKRKRLIFKIKIYEMQ